MKKGNAFRSMEHIDSTLIEEAEAYKAAKKKNAWGKWGAMAACLCLVTAGAFFGIRSHGEPHTAPNPNMVQVVNPIVTVESVEEMERYLDYSVPVLDKEVEAYSVLVVDSYPKMAQIRYADGSSFRMQYGSGDISGIYGGSLEETKDVDGVKVEFYRYADTAYAIWEQNGFAFCYTYTDGNSDVESVRALINK